MLSVTFFHTVTDKEISFEPLQAKERSINVIIRLSDLQPVVMGGRKLFRLASSVSVYSLFDFQRGLLVGYSQFWPVKRQTFVDVMSESAFEVPEGSRSLRKAISQVM
ncbi:hypothetical protein R1sor_006428 [Riccia sorocarpa]|uniref:Uncharacterized protein n=1 Tax=Riccia sorocarpa TaxID=122646 RepID=A0ABD3HML5_9MARC